jgi:hypothetical protein
MIVKYYKAQDFGKCGDLRTKKKMEEDGYKMTMCITIPNKYIGKIKNN